MLDSQTPNIKLLADLIDGNTRPMAQSERVPKTEGLDSEECALLRQSLIVSDPETNKKEG